MIHRTALLIAVLTVPTLAPAQDEVATELVRRAKALLLERQKDDPAVAGFAFEDPQRLDWHYVPRERKGLSLEAMPIERRVEAHDLLRKGLSTQGYLAACAVMSLEEYLRVSSGQDYRNPLAYYWSVFGEPGPESPWGFRVEGHHLSANFTIAGKELRPTPFFIGANPARVPSGPSAGLQILGEQEDRGRDLARSLDAAQMQGARIGDAAPGDVLLGPGREAVELGTKGLPFESLDADQKGRLLLLLESVAGFVHRDLAALEMRRVRDAGLEKLRFAWAGPTLPGERHYWRIQGPTLIVEYDCTAPTPGHIHLLWRDPERDFGRDLLRSHLDGEKH